MSLRTPKSPRPRKVKTQTRDLPRKPITPTQVVAAAFAMRSVKRSGAETNAHRNARVATPILGPEWSRRRIELSFLQRIAEAPCDNPDTGDCGEDTTCISRGDDEKCWPCQACHYLHEEVSYKGDECPVCLESSRAEKVIEEVEDLRVEIALAQDTILELQKQLNQ